MKRKNGSANVFFILFLFIFIIITVVSVEFYHIFTLKEHIDTELSRALNIATDSAMLDEYRMEKSGKSFLLPTNPVSATGAKNIYTDIALAGTKEEPSSHSFEIYISGGGVGNIEFCKKLSKTIIINGNMYEDDGTTS